MLTMVQKVRLDGLVARCWNDSLCYLESAAPTLEWRRLSLISRLSRSADHVWRTGSGTNSIRAACLRSTRFLRILKSHLIECLSAVDSRLKVFNRGALEERRRKCRLLVESFYAQLSRGRINKERTDSQISCQFNRSSQPQIILIGALGEQFSQVTGSGHG